MKTWQLKIPSTGNLCPDYTVEKAMFVLFWFMNRAMTGQVPGQHQLFTFVHKEWWKVSESRRSKIFFVCLSSVDHGTTREQQSIFAVLKNMLNFLETASHCRVLAWNFSFPINVLTHSACSVRSEQKAWIPRSSKLMLFLTLWDFKTAQTSGLNSALPHLELCTEQKPFSTAGINTAPSQVQNIPQAKPLEKIVIQGSDSKHLSIKEAGSRRRNSCWASV